jgi:hypothetical protein
MIRGISLVLRHGILMAALAPVADFTTSDKWFN